MSIIFTASPPKDCSKKGHNQFFHHLKSNRKLLLSLSGLIFSLLSISFLIWLIFHPTDPKFYLKDLSARNSTISTTFISKNPNSHASIYYDKLHVYLAYAGVQITPDVALPPFNQGQLDSDILSANLVGPTGTQSAASSTVMKLPSLNLKIEGNLRWKVGPWLSGWYKLEVDCMVVLMGRPGLPVPLRRTSQGIATELLLAELNKSQAPLAYRPSLEIGELFELQKICSCYIGDLGLYLKEEVKFSWE
ncbi:NDR1/HIN1-like protein 26 [Carex rostrata]